MPINQTKFLAPKAGAAPADGVLTRLADGFKGLTASNQRLDALSLRLGNADLPVLEQRLSVVEQSAGALPARVSALEARVVKLETAQAAQAQQLQRLETVQAAQAEQLQRLDRHTDERIDRAFAELKQLRHDVQALQERLDGKPPGKGGKSSA